jgi:hypothetical protein
MGEVSLTFAIAKDWRPVPLGLDLECATLAELQYLCFEGYLNFTVKEKPFANEDDILTLIHLLTSFIGVIYRLSTNAKKTWIRYEGGTHLVIFEQGDDGKIMLRTNFSKARAYIASETLNSELIEFVRANTSILLADWPELSKNPQFADYIIAATERAAAGQRPFPWDVIEDTLVQRMHEEFNKRVGK